MRCLVLILVALGVACSQADASFLRRPTARRPSGQFKPPSGYTNTYSWDNTTGGAGDYEPLLIDGSTDDLDGMADLSICFWAHGRVAAFSQFVSAWGASDNQILLAMPTAAGTLRLYVASTGADAGSYYDSTSGFATDGDWWHACVTHDSGTVAMYKDGSSVTVTPAGSPPSTFRDATKAVYIGGQTVANVDFQRLVDDLVIYYDKALTGPEVTTIYGGDVAGVPGYTHYYRFENNFTDEAGGTVTQVNGTGDYSFSATIPF